MVKMLTFVRVRVVFDNFAIRYLIFKRFLSLETSLFDLKLLTSQSLTENVSKMVKMLTFVRVRVVFDNFAICDPIFKRFFSLEPSPFKFQFLF